MSAQQSAETIRGRVVGPDSQPIANVQVLAVSFVGGVQRTTRTDRNGRYSIVYANGEGDYWVQFVALGFVSTRFQVKRRGDQEVMIADARLLHTQALETVNVSASAGRTAIARNNNSQEITGSDKQMSTGFATVAPDVAGNLVAQASAMPGVQLIPGVDGSPDRFSIFGLGGDQNNATVNGLQQDFSKLPRDANTTMQLRTGYDISTGGASGATIAINTNSGTNQMVRPFSLVLNTPQVQWNDRIGRASQYTSVSVGGRLTGPRVMDKDFYNVAFQFDRRQQDLATLNSSNPSLLQSAGVSPDSVARFSNILQAAHIPQTHSGSTTSRTSGSMLGVFDWASKSPSSGQALTLALNGSFQINGPSAIAPLSTAASLGDSKSGNAGLSLRHTNYFGSGVLTETVVSASGTDISRSPLAELPSASVLVTSRLADGAQSTRSLAFGGGANASSSNTYAVGGRNTLSRMSDNNHHRFKLFSELRYERSAERQSQNLLGRFTYQSLEDLARNQPSSFTRRLNTVNAKGDEFIGALGVGDTWFASHTLQVQYGLRLDANTFPTKPQINGELMSALGVNNSRLPDRVYFSPRLGFSKVIREERDITTASGFYASSWPWTITGGIGLFQNMRGPDIATRTLANTGLATSSQQIVCIGDATPVPDWDALQRDPTNSPTTCQGGATASSFANSAPGITLFSRDFVQPRSLRSTLNWSSHNFGGHLRIASGALYSINFNQTDYADINFRPSGQFTLAGEGNRPVFVLPSSISAASGLIDPRASRLASQFSTVSELRSNLRSQTAQFSLDLLQFPMGEPFVFEASYKYTNIREQYRGFGSASGDPQAVETGKGSLPSHDFGVTVRYKIRDAAVLNLYTRVSSGFRFTPIVSGDVNGDGNAFNDRAFVYNPALVNNAELAAGMTAVLNGGSGAARDCLRKQLNTVSARNSCAAPWTVGYSQLQMVLNSRAFRIPSRATISFTLANPVGAADLLLHGSDKLRGWGQTPALDQSLLYVTGFDPASSKFQYHVNQRFGTSNIGTTSRTPVVLTARVSLDLAPRRDWQDLNQALERGRSRAGNKMNEGAARQYATTTGYMFTNPMAYLLSTSEYLHLTRMQADSLARMSRRYTKLVDTLWTPLAKKMAALPSEYDRRSIRAEMIHARTAALDYLILVVPHIRSMLTKGQILVLNPRVVSIQLNTRYWERVREGVLAEFSVYSTP